MKPVTAGLVPPLSADFLYEGGGLSQYPCPFRSGVLGKNQRALSTKAAAILRLMGSLLYESSGCHCSPQMKRFPGMHTPSMRPSSLTAVVVSEGASSLTA